MSADELIRELAESELAIRDFARRAGEARRAYGCSPDGPIADLRVEAQLATEWKPLHARKQAAIEALIKYGMPTVARAVSRQSGWLAASSAKVQP